MFRLRRGRLAWVVAGSVSIAMALAGGHAPRPNSASPVGSSGEPPLARVRIPAGVETPLPNRDAVVLTGGAMPRAPLVLAQITTPVQPPLPHFDSPPTMPAVP